MPPFCQLLLLFRTKRSVSASNGCLRIVFFLGPTEPFHAAVNAVSVRDAWHRLRSLAKER